MWSLLWLCMCTPTLIMFSLCGCIWPRWCTRDARPNVTTAFDTDRQLPRDAASLHPDLAKYLKSNKTPNDLNSPELILFPLV